MYGVMAPMLTKKEFEGIRKAGEKRRADDLAKYGPESRRMKKRREYLERVSEDGYRCSCGRRFQTKAKLHNHKKRCRTRWSGNDERPNPKLLV